MQKLPVNNAHGSWGFAGCYIKILFSNKYKQEDKKLVGSQLSSLYQNICFTEIWPQFQCYVQNF